MAVNYLIRALAVLLFSSSPAVQADAGTTSAVEIDHLITAIGESGCRFVRNGKRHTAREAEEHIRMKYRRGKRYAPTTELFIERLASKSSMSRKPYWMECPGNEPLQSAEWLKAELARYRENVTEH